MYLEFLPGWQGGHLNSHTKEENTHIFIPVSFTLKYQIQSPLSHIYDCISLDVIHVRVSDTQLLAISLSRADDSCGHSVLQSKRTPNSNHKLPRPQVCWVSQQQHRQFFLSSVRDERAHERKTERERSVVKLGPSWDGNVYCNGISCSCLNSKWNVYRVSVYIWSVSPQNEYTL